MIGFLSVPASLRDKVPPWRIGRAKRTAIRLRTEMVGRSVLAEPLNSLSLNRLSAHRDGSRYPPNPLNQWRYTSPDSPGGDFIPQRRRDAEKTEHIKPLSSLRLSASAGDLFEVPFSSVGGMRLFPKSGRAGRSFGHSMDAPVGRGRAACSGSVC